MDGRDKIWDLLLTQLPAAAATTTSSSSSSGHSQEYVLQVVGKAGEAPPKPLPITLELNHSDWDPKLSLTLRVQSGPQGLVRLGGLEGIRNLKAKFDFERAAEGAGGREGAAGQGEGGLEGGAGGEVEGLLKGASRAERVWELNRGWWRDVPIQPKVGTCEGGDEEHHLHPYYHGISMGIAHSNFVVLHLKNLEILLTSSSRLL
jgi:hypothetical protein